MYKILLVEDDELVSELYQIVFTTKGCEVTTAIDGIDGLEKLKLAIPDIILLDLMMPRMNGVDMLSELNALDHLRHVPVFIISNLNDPQIVETCYKKGAKQFIVKSQCIPQALYEKIDAYLSPQLNNAKQS
jgi:CheY-like chemotaxis protein